MDAFNTNKISSFNAIIAGITGQPATWIVSNAAAAGSSTAIQLASQVHAPPDQVATVKASMEAAVADGGLAAQLKGIGLSLVNGSGMRAAGGRKAGSYLAHPWSLNLHPATPLPPP